MKDGVGRVDTLRAKSPLATWSGTTRPVRHAPQPAASRPVIIYARYSSEGQNPKSCEDQERECRAYAARQGWTVSRVFRDKAISGRCGRDERHGWDELLKFIEGGGLPRGGIVLLWSANRWSRDFADGMIEALRLHRRGIVLADTAQGLIDSSTIAGRLQLSFGLAAAQEQSDRISADVRRGKEAQRTAGNFPTLPPYGYRMAGPYPGRYLEPHPDQAPIVQQIFQWADEGVTAAEIARRLHQQRVPTARDSAWRACTIRTMLVNPTYRGLVVHYGPRDIDGRRRQRFTVPRELWEVHEGKHEPIISAALWERVAARWQPGTRAPHGPHRHYPLTGLVVCEACGRPCKVIGSDYWRAYRCRRYGEVGDCESTRAVSIRALEEAVRALIKRLAGNGAARRKAARQIATRLAEQAAEETGERTGLENEIVALRAKQGRLVAAIEAGTAPRAITERIEEIDDALADAQRRLDSLTAVAAPDLVAVTAALDAACQTDPDLWGLRDLDVKIVLPADDSHPTLWLSGQAFPLPVKLARRLPRVRS